MPYLTPDSGDLSSISLYVLPAPASMSGRAVVAGALAQLGREYNWQENGTATPDETAQAFLDATAQTWRSHGPDTTYLAAVLTAARSTHYCHYPLSQSFACLVKPARNLSLLTGSLRAWRDGMGDGLAGMWFDGGDNRLSFPMASMAFDFPSNSGALAVWAKLEPEEYANNLRWHRLVHFTDYAGQSLELYRRGNTVSDFSLARTTMGVPRTVTATITPGQPGYTYFGADWNTTANTLEMFVDGVSVGAAQAGLGWRGAPSAGRIGGMTSSHFWRGDIAHVAMWSAPLGAALHAAIGSVP